MKDVKKAIVTLAALLLVLGVGSSWAKIGLHKGGGKGKTFTGEISDSMCGLKHMMPGSAKECADKCVQGGAKYVLADQTAKTVYQLSDQEKAKQFSGQEVKVAGTLKGDSITVTSIEAAQ